VDVGEPRHVRLQCHRVRAQIALGRFQGRLVPSGDDDRRPFPGERLGHAESDAAVAAGDHGDLSFEAIHGYPPFLCVPSKRGNGRRIPKSVGEECRPNAGRCEEKIREGIMTDAPNAERPVRVWPAVVLGLVYWIHQVYVAQSDMAMFPRFMSKSMGSLAFLVLFLILWLSNGTVRGKVRLLGLGLF